MKDSYVSDFKVKTDIISFLMVSENPQQKISKKELPYLILRLQDKTGDIDARVWDIPKELDVNLLKIGTIVKIFGAVNEWNDALQLNVNKIRLAVPEDNTEMGDYLPRSERDPTEMFGEVLMFASNTSMKDPNLIVLINTILMDRKEQLLLAPAAKSVHHGFIGGLLEHILSMIKIAHPIAAHYNVNQDLLTTACILHDIGKLDELSYPIGIDYTVEGTLLGHITLGLNYVSKMINGIENFPPRLKMAVLHLIASHHGLLEWGSPKIPLMKEAIAFHIIDMLDARMEICKKALAGNISESGMTEWSKTLGGSLFKCPENW